MVLHAQVCGRVGRRQGIILSRPSSNRGPFVLCSWLETEALGERGVAAPAVAGGGDGEAPDGLTVGAVAMDVADAGGEAGGVGLPRLAEDGMREEGPDAVADLIDEGRHRRAA